LGFDARQVRLKSGGTAVTHNGPNTDSRRKMAENQRVGEARKSSMNKAAMQFGIAIFGLTALMATASAAESDAELAVVQAKVSGLFSEIKPEHVFPSQIDGWYTVRKGAVVAYISADGRYLLQGDLIDLETQVNLSEQDRNLSRMELLSELPEEQMIVFSPEEVKHTVSIFTDIDCTYCRRLHSQIDDYLAQGIEIRYMLYPRSGPATPSWTKAEQVWCAQDRNEALTLAKLDQDFQSGDCDPSIISTHYAMGQDIGLRGTPAIVLEDGTLVSGYLPPLQLTEALSATK
jgi:thiol:disulfide interchange protein DsbC